MVKHAKAQEKGAGSSLRRRQTLLAWGFALPFAVIFCVFMLIPLISSMAMSFTDITSRDLRTPFNVNFVGLDQYIALFSDKRFLHSLGVTGIFVLIGLPITMIIALAFAVALNKGSQHLNAFFRALFSRRSWPASLPSPLYGATSCRETACSTPCFPSSAYRDRTGCTTLVMLCLP